MSKQTFNSNTLVGEPVRRVVSGAAVGAFIGLAVGATIAMLVLSNVVLILLSTVLGGLIMGGLTGLNRRLPMTAEVAGVDADAQAVVRVNVEGLADLKADVAQRMVNVT